MQRNDTGLTRQRMAPDARREAILDAAHALFMERGWEAVTIADVLEAASISKGGFYHHFAAKEDLLSGIIARMTERAVKATELADDSTCGDALARLNAFLTGSIRWTADNSEGLRGLVQILSKPGNNVLYQRVCDAEATVVMPVLARIIRDGVFEGTFDTVDADLTAGIMLSLSQGRREILVDVLGLATQGDLTSATKQLDARMRAEGAIFDRLLGLAEGSVAMANPREYRRMLAGLVGPGGDKVGVDASAHRNLERKD